MCSIYVKTDWTAVPNAVPRERQNLPLKLIMLVLIGAKYLGVWTTL